MQTARGLAAAHDQGLVHRDIKPANILLPENVERVLITDFGLARAADDASLTRSGVIAGTPQYMSPEQARGEGIDHRSDLFSLGSMMYAMATGHPPFRAETPYGILRRITDHAHRPIQEVRPDVPLWLCQFIDRLLSKSSADRFSSAEEVATLLEECLAHVQQPNAVPLLSILQPRKKVRRFRKSVLLSGLAVAAMTVVTLSQWSPFTTNHRSNDTLRSEDSAETSTENDTTSNSPPSDTELQWHPDDQLDQIESTLSELNRKLEK